MMRRATAEHGPPPPSMQAQQTFLPPTPSTTSASSTSTSGPAAGNSSRDAFLGSDHVRSESSVCLSWARDVVLRVCVCISRFFPEISRWFFSSFRGRVFFFSSLAFGALFFKVVVGFCAGAGASNWWCWCCRGACTFSSFFGQGLQGKQLKQARSGLFVRRRVKAAVCRVPQASRFGSCRSLATPLYSAVPRPRSAKHASVTAPTAISSNKPV